MTTTQNTMSANTLAGREAGTPSTIDFISMRDYLAFVDREREREATGEPSTIEVWED